MAKKWNTTKAEAMAEFKVVCKQMKQANDEHAPMNVCVALGKRCGELMGVLMNDFGMSRDDLLKISGGAAD